MQASRSNYRPRKPMMQGVAMQLESAGKDHVICRGTADHADCSSLPALVQKGFNPHDHLMTQSWTNTSSSYRHASHPCFASRFDWRDEILAVRCRSIKSSLESYVTTRQCCETEQMRRGDSTAATLTSSQRIPAPSSPSPGSIAAFRSRGSL